MTGRAVDYREGGVTTVDITRVLTSELLLTLTDTILPETPHIVEAPFRVQLNPEFRVTGDGIDTVNVPDGLPEGIVKFTVRLAVALLALDESAIDCAANTAVVLIVKVSNPVKDSTSHPSLYVYNSNLPVGLIEAGIIVFDQFNTVLPVITPVPINVRFLLPV